jgi:hypothetical protein
LGEFIRPFVCINKMPSKKKKYNARFPAVNKSCMLFSTVVELDNTDISMIE